MTACATRLPFEYQELRRKSTPIVCLEYTLIEQHYGDRTAERSGIPLINHIREGLEVLRQYSAWPTTMQAFCLHPLIQADKDYATNYEFLANHQGVNGAALQLAVEYRNAANAYLCKPETDDWDIDRIRAEIKFSHIHPQVRKMLIADKVQNMKDFLFAHRDTHPRSEQLTKYFQNWLKILGVIPK